MDATPKRFRQIESWEAGTFEEDFLVMNTETLDTVVLNSTATLLWEALKWPQSVEDLADLLAEAFTKENREQLRARAREVVEALLARDLLIEV